MGGSDGAARGDFPIDDVLTRVREAVRPYPPAAMFALRDEGFGTLWQQLAACIISIRTRDETSLPIALALFARAPDPAALLALPTAHLATLLAPATFAEAKVGQLRRLAEVVLAEHGGTPPTDDDAVRALPGIGPKCANLALGVALDRPRISVDVHVHRVTNRWGYVAAPTPERTLAELEAVLPRRHWTELNALLVPFGKHVCVGTAPFCSRCPVRGPCAQVGVTRHR